MALSMLIVGQMLLEQDFENNVAVKLTYFLIFFLSNDTNRLKGGGFAVIRMVSF
jgi:hypothetical protein